MCPEFGCFDHRKIAKRDAGMIIDFGSKHGISLKRETGAQQHVTKCGFRSPKIVKHETGALNVVPELWSKTENKS